MLTRSVTRATIAAVLGATALAGAQPADVDGLLKLKPSPGVEAMLLAHATDGRVGRRWIGLLTDKNPEVRLSAARALGVTNVRSAANPLMQALARERDPNVVNELVQALAILGSDEDVLQVYAHLDRLGGARATLVVDGLAASRPALVARHLVVAAPLRFNSELVRPAYERLARTAPDEAAQVDAAVAADLDPAMVEGIIRGATGAKRRLPPPIVHAGLRLDDAGRLATLGYLAAVYGSPERVAAERVLEGATPSEVAGATPEGRWIGALLARWAGQNDRAGLVDLIEAIPVVAWIRTTPRPVLAVLSAGERTTFARRFTLSESATRALIETRFDEPTPEGGRDLVAVLTDVPAAMLTGVVRLTNCRPEAADERFASLRYHADRRPASLSMNRESWSPGCERAARAAVAMAYGTPPRGDADRTLVLVRLDPEFMACLADREAPAALERGAASESGWRTPRKLQDRVPAYPETAIRSRLQGVVVVDARIERNGCVSEARVVRSVHALLDTAAVQAVSRWRYEPTTLNGERVPLLVAVDVAFTLK